MRDFTIKNLDSSRTSNLVEPAARVEVRVVPLAPVQLSAPVVYSLIMSSLLALLLALF